MKKITIEEFLKRLEDSHNLTINDINNFEVFLEKNRLKARYIAAVNKSFSSLGDVADEMFNREVIEVKRECLFSCMIDWSLNEDDNWEYIHVLWGESE